MNNLDNASIACKIREIVDKKSHRGSVSNALIGENSKSHKLRKAGSTLSKATSLCSTSSLSIVGKNKRSSSLISDVTLDSVVEGEDDFEDTEDLKMTFSACKRMRAEIDQLRCENKDLLLQQITRETEIRLEVSEEMASRSEHLLQRIQDLQDELNSHTNKVSEIEKSCKKVKRNQRERENELIARDLEEAEEVWI
jgi:septal ring factor EnvC (AmiA/AmiB activator)